MRIGISALALALSISASGAEYFTFAKWAALPDFLRSMYIAGMYDQMLDVQSETIGKEDFRRCLANSGMTNGQLAENILRYGNATPKLQQGGVSMALWLYLLDSCPMPAAKK